MQPYGHVEEYCGGKVLLMTGRLGVWDFGWSGDGFLSFERSVVGISHLLRLSLSWLSRHRQKQSENSERLLFTYISKFTTLLNPSC